MNTPKNSSLPAWIDVVGNRNLEAIDGGIYPIDGAYFMLRRKGQNYLLTTDDGVPFDIEFSPEIVTKYLQVGGLRPSSQDQLLLCIRTIKEVRRYQRLYFAKRSKETLTLVKAEEKKLDGLVAGLPADLSAQELVELTIQMREAQQRYFKTLCSADKNTAIHLEKRVDALLNPTPSPQLGLYDSVS